MSQTRKVDVIVVGAGASGALVASELAQNGVRVVCMDKGPHYTDSDFRLKFDEIRYYARGAIVPHMTTDPMTWRERSLVLSLFQQVPTMTIMATTLGGTVRSWAS